MQLRITRVGERRERDERAVGVGDAPGTRHLPAQQDASAQFHPSPFADTPPRLPAQTLASRACLLLGCCACVCLLCTYAALAALAATSAHANYTTPRHHPTPTNTTRVASATPPAHTRATHRSLLNRLAIIDDVGVLPNQLNQSDPAATDRHLQLLMPRWVAADGMLRTRAVVRDLVFAVAHLAARERDAVAASV